MGEKIKNEFPSWLKNLQENSWELELLISGGAIFSLFQLSEFYIDWIQGIRVMSHLPGASVVLMIGMFGIKVLTLGFILHLSLRAYWLSLVCINYVFPQGIREKKSYLQKPFQIKKKTNKDLKDQIINVDRSCGLVMYMTIISAITILGLIVLTVFSVLISIFFEDRMDWFPINISVFFISLLLIYLFDLISFGLLRKIPILSYLLYPIFKLYDLISFRSFYKRSLQLFSTNIKKFRFLIATLVFSFFAFLSAFASLYKVQHWTNIFDDRDYYWQRAEIGSDDNYYFSVADLHYMENWKDDKSRPFGIGQKVVQGNFLEIYVRYEKAYDILIEATADSVGDRYFSKVLELLVDDEVVSLKWYPSNKSNLDIGVMGMIDLSELKNGEHSIILTIKEKYAKIHEQFVNRPIMVRIPFWIDRPNKGWNIMLDSSIGETF